MDGPWVLVVEDDASERRALERLLQRRGYDVLTADRGDEALAHARAQDIAVAIVDLGLPDQSGFDVVRALLRLRPHTECVILTGRGAAEGADAARAAGASDYFEKPILDTTRFFQVIRRAMEVRDLRRTIELLDHRNPSDDLLGQSIAIERLRARIDRIAPANAPVLITGDSGVGKEKVAEAIHRQSRRTGEFVRINCAALPAALIEAELFGAEEGTYTGQKGKRIGLFGQADLGTILLDEIGELPLELQPKLLRALESQRYRPLGAREERVLTARVLAATHVDLPRACAAGRFREDLYYRLAVLTIEVPPLRERTEDIALLAQHFARAFALREGRDPARFTADAIAALEARPWPGNVRELANTVMRAVLLANGPVLDRDAIGVSPSVAPAVASDPWAPWLDLPLTEAKAAVVDAFTAHYLRRRLQEAGGNVTRAAIRAGLQRPNFRREMRRVGLDQPDESG